MIQTTWLTVALYAGLIQGCFLSYLIWKKKQSNRRAVRYLTVLLLLLSTLMFLRVSYQPEFVRELAEIILLPDVILFLAGPLIFLFVRSLLRLPKIPVGKRRLHFLPALFHVVVVNTFLGLHMKGYLSYLTNDQLIAAFFIIEGAAIISLAGYIIWSFRLFLSYRKAFFKKYAAPTHGNFLLAFFWSCCLLLTFWLVSYSLKLIQARIDYIAYTLFWVLLVGAIYFLAYKILQHPAVLDLPSLNRTVPPKALVQVQSFVQEEQSYLDPHLKVGDLAKALDIPKHDLSRLINRGLQQNFFDFINSYRVREFIQRRSDPAFDRFNTLELAFQSGFNSKSAFNRAFRKETGQSPRQYFLEKRPTFQNGSTNS